MVDKEYTAAFFVLVFGFLESRIVVRFCQKNGVNQNELVDFYTKIKNHFDLDVIGLMCIPPFVNDTSPYFIKMKSLSEKIKLSDLSMGMSDDYLEALKYSATYVRIGSKIMGNRD